MKKLSEFKDKEGIKVIGKLMIPISHIVSNQKNKEQREKGVMAFASSICLENTDDIFEILAIMNEKNIEDYECNAGTIIFDTLTLLDDKDFLQLFGLQSET